MTEQEEVVMTARKTDEEAIVRIDREKYQDVDHDQAHFVAQGPFKGIVINKVIGDLMKTDAPEVAMAFSVYMTDSKRKSARESKEHREVRFWFKSETTDAQQSTTAREYFKKLLQPEAFPRDYVTFIKKALILTQHFPLIKRVELVLRPDSSKGWLDYSEDTLRIESATPLQGTATPTNDMQDMIEEEDEYEGEGIIENFITVHTPAVYDYQYLPEVPVSDKRWIPFRLRAKADAHIALSSVYGDTIRKTYEIVIGGWDNTQSVIRAGGQGKSMEESVTLKVLSGNEFRSFWVSWDKGFIRVGEGRKRGQDVFLSWEIPPKMLHSVNCLAVSTGPGSTGEWEFVEILRPPKPEDQTKSARRAKFRLSLLWLAKKQKMLQILEDTYPNSMNTAELLRLCNIKLHDMMTAVVFLRDLQKRGLITEITKGLWIRAPSGSHDKTHAVKMVERVPPLSGRETPTIAVVTALYTEKTAVDAMMEFKTSYVQHKTEGESQVYTLGRIGAHQVISTKLSRVGSSRNAAISAGNTVTRLLGLFEKVQHVFLVGVAGAVPHYTDYAKHVRLGDIVVGVPVRKDGPIYVRCDQVNTKAADNDTYDYVTRSWSCRDETLQSCVKQMRDLMERDTRFREYGKSYSRPWEKYIEQGLETLHAEESSFHRPAPKTDKLFAFLDNEIVQVEHPQPSLGLDRLHLENRPNIRYGPLGSSKYIARNLKLRMDFARNFPILAFDGEFDAVVEAICGSRKDSFLIIRGICDYTDGSKNKDWQPYAALAAAAYMKSLITALPSARRTGGYYY